MSDNIITNLVDKINTLKKEIDYVGNLDSLMYVPRLIKLNEKLDFYQHILSNLQEKKDVLDNISKNIFITLNGKKVAIEIDDRLGLFPDAKILPAYSEHCYETNACCACKDDKTGKTCLNKD